MNKKSHYNQHRKNKESWQFMLTKEENAMAQQVMDLLGVNGKKKLFLKLIEDKLK